MTLVTDFLPAAGTHASRPSTAPDGTLYSCTTHSLVYRYTTSGGWVTWATLGGGGSTVDTNLALDHAYTISAGTVWGSYPDTGPPVEVFSGTAWVAYTSVQKLTDGIKTGPYTGGMYTGFQAASADPVFNFDFTTAKTIGQVIVWGAGGGGGLGFPTGFTVEWSDDNSSWTTAFSDTGNSTTGLGGGVDHSWRAPLNFTAVSHRYWRVKVLRSADIFIGEIEIMGH